MVAFFKNNSTFGEGDLSKIQTGIALHHKKTKPRCERTAGQGINVQQMLRSQKP